MDFEQSVLAGFGVLVVFIILGLGTLFLIGDSIESNQMRVCVENGKNWVQVEDRPGNYECKE